MRPSALHELHQRCTASTPARISIFLDMVRVRASQLAVVASLFPAMRQVSALAQMSGVGAAVSTSAGPGAGPKTGSCA